MHLVGIVQKMENTSVAHWLDEDDFKGNGGVMNHETLESIAKRKNPLQLTMQVLDGYLLRMESLKIHR